MGARGGRPVLENFGCYGGYAGDNQTNGIHSRRSPGIWGKQNGGPETMDTIGVSFETFAQVALRVRTRNSHSSRQTIKLC